MRFSTNHEEQKRLAYDIYKYQNVCSSILTSYVHSDVYQESSIIGMRAKLRAYLNTGRKDLQRLSQDFYTAIDEAKQRGVQIYQPQDHEMARDFKNIVRKKSSTKTKKWFQPSLVRSSEKESNKLNISKETLDKIKSSQNAYYGLRLEQSLKIFNSLEERTGYIRAYNEIDPNMTFQKVRIEVREEN